MRIAICGTHGTGKTTLARALSERIGLPMIEEVAREVLTERYFKNTKEYIQSSEDVKKMIQWEIYMRQETSEMARTFIGFVSDRSVFDAVAYTAAYGFNLEMVNTMLGRAIAHALNTYDLLVYVPIMWELHDDGFRDMDEQLRRRVNEYIQRYVHAFSTLGGNVLLISTEKHERRVELVIDEVEKLKAVKRMTKNHEVV